MLNSLENFLNILNFYGVRQILARGRSDSLECYILNVEGEKKGFICPELATHTSHTSIFYSVANIYYYIIRNEHIIYISVQRHL